MILRQSRRLYGCWPLKRGLIATGRNQDRYLVMCGATSGNPGGTVEAYSRNCQTFAAAPAEPGGSPSGLVSHLERGIAERSIPVEGLLAVGKPRVPAPLHGSVGAPVR